MFFIKLTLRLVCSRIHLVSEIGLKDFQEELLQFFDPDVLEQDFALLAGMDLQGKEAF